MSAKLTTSRLAFRGRPRLRTPLLAFFGHHKAASSWMATMLRDVATHLSLHRVVVNYPRDFDYDLGKFVERERLDLLVYMNAEMEYVRQLPAYRAVHMIRDPRDMCVSAYFSHLASHKRYESWPELDDLRAQLRGLSKRDGLLREMDYLGSGTFQHMAAWDYALPNVLELRMEEVTRAPYDSFLRVLDFLDLLDTGVDRTRLALIGALSDLARRVERKVPSRRFRVPFAPRRIAVATALGIAWRNRFERQSGGRRPGQVDESSHYRQGAPGDWRNHFDSHHEAEFGARFADLLRICKYV